jgi:6-phosphogluconolactonase/glucosamine-6-phosphate isomerase/deaminase
VSAPRVSVVDDLGAAAGQLLVEGLEAAIARSGRARLAVPGGTGPVPVSPGSRSTWRPLWPAAPR